MDRIKKIFLYIFTTFVFLITIIYLCFLFFLPFLINNFANEITTFINKKSSIEFYCKNIFFKSNFDLSFKLNADEISINQQNKNISDIKNLKSDFNIFNLSKTKISTDFLSINLDNIDKNKKNNKRKKQSFNFSNLPQVTIKNFLINSRDHKIITKNLEINKNKISFITKINSNFWDNQLIIGENGYIETSNYSIYAKNLEILSGNSKLNINGKIFDFEKNINFNLTGENLPVKDIQKSLLFYQKSKDPAKKFIENFKNYNGFADINLNIKHDGMYGECIISDISAKAVWFDIPLYFKKVVLSFNKDTITSKSQGFVGGQEAIHTLNISNLGKKDKEVIGIFKANLKDNFNFVPDLKIKNYINTTIKYNIKNNDITVDYILDIPQESDLLYKNAFLGIRDKKRQFLVQTLKQNNDLKITKYHYGIIKNNTIKNIISGNGLLKKINGKFQPQFITCKTTGYAPVSVTGSFSKYVQGGEFNGNLNYNFLTKQILGNFEIINTKFKNYFVKSAKINANNYVNILAEGLLLGEKFSCTLNAKNKLDSEIYVYKLNLFLERFKIQNSKSKKKKHHNFKKFDISSKIKNSDVTIENWAININEIIKDKLILNNIELIGSLKNDIFNFALSELQFAEGIIYGKGKYNFIDESSFVDFNAKCINSNTIADIFFNLPNQVEGIANAKFQVNTKNKLEEIYAYGEFEIDNGFLPKLGSTEFMFKNNKKIKVADLTNIDFSKKKALQSDIKGSFFVENSLLKDIKITSQQKFLSLLIKGNYEIKKQSGCVDIFGKYNKEAPEGIKILFVPLDFILKVIFRPENTYELYKNELNQIPNIETKKENEQYFRVKLNGNINADKVNVEIKGIKQRN